MSVGAVDLGILIVYLAGVVANVGAPDGRTGEGARTLLHFPRKNRELVMACERSE